MTRRRQAVSSSKAREVPTASAAPGGWPLRLVLIGLAGMVIGLLDPLEGSPLVALASGLIALGAHLEGSRLRRPAAVAFGLVLVGVGAMWVLTPIGGVGGSTGHSMWWAAWVSPYPAGWILGLLTGGRIVLEQRRY